MVILEHTTSAEVLMMKSNVTHIIHNILFVSHLSVVVNLYVSYVGFAHCLPGGICKTGCVFCFGKLSCVTTAALYCFQYTQLHGMVAIHVVWHINL